MPTILCYGDSNTHGTVPMDHLDDVRRFGPHERWAGIMRRRRCATDLAGRTHTVWPASDSSCQGREAAAMADLGPAHGACRYPSAARMLASTIE